MNSPLRKKIIIPIIFQAGKTGFYARLFLTLFGLVVAHASFSTNYLMNNSSNTKVCASSDNFFDSGGNGSNYGTNENFTITFTPGTASQYIQFTFTSFATSTGDFLTFYDGPSTASAIIGSYSGASSPGTIGARNAGGSITVKFTSGASTSSGWIAAISCSATPVSPNNIIMTNNATVTTCSATFNDDGGSGSNYADNDDQTMTFYPATAGRYIQLDFTTFATSSTSDYLSFYDGSSTASPLIGTFAVSSTPGTIGATNASGALTIKFISDASGNSSGWTANVSCSTTPVQTSVIIMTNSANVTTCSGTFYDQGGSSNDYENNSNQIITITPATSGKYVQLDFTSFATVSTSDHLAFYDGPSTASPLLGNFAVSSTPGTVGARNASGVLTVQFISDGSGTAGGWAANVTCSATPVQPSTIIMTNGSSATTCGASFYDEGGASNDYENSSNQTMTFHSLGSGQFIRLTFTSFTTASPADFISFYNGPTTGSPLIGTFSGSSSPGTIDATAGTSLTVQFTSDATTTASGWAANVTCTGTLPIELISFNAICEAQNAIDLRWETASESNNDFFTLERSSAPPDFKSIATIHAVGNSQTISKYQFTDHLETEGNKTGLYYRLKQTDFDKKYKYFNIVHTACQDISKTLEIYPNPGPGIFYVENLPPNITLSVFNAFGVLVRQLVSPTLIDLSSFPSGIYVVRFLSSESMSTKRIVLTK